MTLSKESRGFSLVEVLIALVILSISLLALAGLMVQTTKNNSFGSHMTEAATVAQDEFEILRARPYNSMLAGGDPSVPGANGQTYSRNWTIVRSGSFADTSITVTWADPTNHSITFGYNILSFDP